MNKYLAAGYFLTLVGLTIFLFPMLYAKLEIAVLEFRGFKPTRELDYYSKRNRLNGLMLLLVGIVILMVRYAYY